MTSAHLHLLLFLAAWLALVFAAAFFAAVNAAMAHLRVRHLLERDDTSQTAINRWLRWAPAMRAAVAVWHAILFSAAAVLLLPLATAATPFFPGYLHYLPLVIALFILITIGALAPLYAGSSCPESLTLHLLNLLHAWAAATRYFNLLLLSCARASLRLTGIRVSPDTPFLADDDSPLPDAVADDAIEEEEHEMIKSIFEFGDTVVREVMTPRTEMEAVPASCTLDEAIQRSQQSGHARLPVYEGDLDHIIGVLYVRDALAFWSTRTSQPPALTDIMRAPFFVPETKKVNELLREFRQLKTQLAVIVDEYGGTSGLVTLEDLIEEIVGDLSDEFDRETDTAIRQLDDATFIVDGAISVYDLNDALDVHIPAAPGFDTVGGYIMYKLGRLPAEGETISEHDFSLTVLSVKERRVEQVKVSRRSPGSPSSVGVQP